MLGTHFFVGLRERIAGGSHGTHVVCTAVNLKEKERKSRGTGEQSHREILGTLTISSAIFPAPLGSRVHSGCSTSDNAPSNAMPSTPTMDYHRRGKNITRTRPKQRVSLYCLRLGLERTNLIDKRWRPRTPIALSSWLLYLVCTRTCEANLSRLPSSAV